MVATSGSTRGSTRSSADSPLALNLTPEVPGIGAFATAQAERHPNLTYIGQDAHDLRMLLWGTPFPHVHDPLVPVHLDHPLYQSDRIRLFLDTWTWYDFLATQDFAYGTRFHGNVAALLGRTPALLLAHDSRTLELAEYHRMPYTLMPEFTADAQGRGPLRGDRHVGVQRRAAAGASTATPHSSSATASSTSGPRATAPATSTSASPPRRSHRRSSP